MKTRLWLGGIAAVLLLASCEGFFNDGTLVKEGIVEYTADGRRLVNLSVPTGGAFSMVDTIARSAIDYYEVIFCNTVGGSTYYRGAGPKGSTIRLSVPEGQYDGTDGTAILLAGTYNQKTLLGTGVLTKVGSTVGIATPITANTTDVTFTVTALEAEVIAAATSAFGITGGTGGLTTAAPDNNFHTTATNIPYFKVPIGYADTEATWEITGLDTLFDPQNTLTMATEIKVSGNPVVTNTSMQELQTDWVFPTLTFLAGISDGDPLDATTLGADGAIEIVIDTTGLTDGWFPLAINIPVRAYGWAQGDLWHIKSGINYRVDTGSADGSGILICVGNEVPITVGTTGP